VAPNVPEVQKVSTFNKSGITNLLRFLLYSFQTILASKYKMATARHLEKHKM